MILFTPLENNNLELMTDICGFLLIFPQAFTFYFFSGFDFVGFGVGLSLHELHEYKPIVMFKQAKESCQMEI